MIRACAFPVLLDEFGVCGTRSKNEKTHMGCELKHVLDHGTEFACVTRRLTRGPANQRCRELKVWVWLVSEARASWKCESLQSHRCSHRYAARF